MHMSNRALFICLILLFLSACHSKPVVKPLFKDAAIQDSLQSFLERIDSIPNSYGAPSLYAVSFWLKGQDSLIRFSANAELWVVCLIPCVTILLTIRFLLPYPLIQ